MFKITVTAPMHFTVTPGTNIVNTKYTMVVVECSSLDVQTLHLIQQAASEEQCLLVLEKPTLLLVKQFALANFSSPRAYTNGKVTMSRPYKRPQPFVLPFLDTVLLHRIIMRFGAMPFKLEEVQLAALNSWGKEMPVSVIRNFVIAAKQMAMLTSDRRKQYRATTWVLMSLQDDLLDAEAHQHGAGV